MARLPRIACFHGGGSNAAIFKVQCQQLQAVLENEFEFVYFDAPFEGSAGPDVLPVFRDFAPFRRWFKVEEGGREHSDGSGYDREGRDGIERVLKMMDAAGTAGDWVAAMGFSQGTRVVGGLLLDQQRRADAGNPRDINLKFGVLCMGSGAPMASEISRATDRDGNTNGTMDQIVIPTLHLHGLKDINLENGRKQLATYYDPNVATLIEINYHHAMPWLKSDIMELATFIRQMHMYTHTEA